MNPASATRGESAPSVLPGFGLPDERLARVAARRAFVAMKHAFMRAAADVDGKVGHILQHKVRVADDVSDLLRVRAVLLASLVPEHERTPLHRWELRSQLDTVFDERRGDTTAIPL